MKFLVIVPMVLFFGVNSQASICERSALVQEQLLKHSQDKDCSLIGPQDLANIAQLNFGSGTDEPLRFILPGDLDGLTGLIKLDMSSNMMDELPEGLFDDLRSLESLNLDSNHFEALPVGIFDHLKSLTFLNLHSNNLTALSSGVVSQNTQLEWLRFSDNKLTVVPDGLIDGLKELKHFALSHNRKLSALPAQMFKDQVQLERLYMNSLALSNINPTTFLGLGDTVTHASFLGNQLNQKNIDILSRIFGDSLYVSKN